jgi:hypothetical protein
MQGPHLKPDICRQALGESDYLERRDERLAKGGPPRMAPSPAGSDDEQPSRFCTPQRQIPHLQFSSSESRAERPCEPTAQNSLLRKQTDTCYFPVRVGHSVSEADGRVAMVRKSCENFVGRVLTGLPAKLARDWVASGGRQVVDDIWSWAALSSRKELTRTNSAGTRPAIIRFCKERLALLVPIAEG